MKLVYEVLPKAEERIKTRLRQEIANALWRTYYGPRSPFPSNCSHGELFMKEADYMLELYYEKQP